jgi:adenylate cyclase
LSLEAAHKAFLAKPEKGNWMILLFGFIFSLFISVVYIFEPSFFHFLDHKLFDTLLQSDLKNEPSDLPVIVNLDEKSLTQFGQWPWPRYRIALLLEKIKALGASSIGLDFVFPEPDRTSFGIAQKDLLRDLNIRVDLRGLPKRVLDHDAFLAETLSQGPFILGFKFLFSAEKTLGKDCPITPLSVTVVREAGMVESQQFLFHPTDIICNLKVLTEAAPLSGFFNISSDADGIIRRAPLLMEYHQKIYPSFSLAAFAQASGIKQIVLKMTSGGIESIRFGETIIPVDANGNLLIRYRGKGKTFAYLSAGDILTDSVSRKQIEGKIVFLGTTATGLGELLSTPVDAVFPGPEIHATIVDNLQRKDFISRPYWIPGLEFGTILAAGILASLLLTWTGAVWSFFLLGLFALGLWQGSQWLFHSKAVFFSCLFPLIILVCNFSFLTLFKYWREEKRLKGRTKELALTQDFTILCLAALAETRDSETGGHILRCQRYVKILAERLARNPKFAAILQPETIDLLYKSSPLHDIGKVGVPDSILLKPGRLTEEEFNEMKRHTLYGRQALQRAEDKFGQGVNSSFLQYGKEMAYTHHERWDGSGYPEGLQGENIPVFGRIMAIADVYDALISKRIYKPPFTHEEAVSIIAQQKGLLFDPEIVEAFLEVHEKFWEVALAFADHKEEGKAFRDQEQVM